MHRLPLLAATACACLAAGVAAAPATSAAPAAPARTAGDPADRTAAERGARPPRDIVARVPYELLRQARIVDFNTVRLSPAGDLTEVRTTDLGAPVRDGSRLAFRLRLARGAVCSPVAPDVYGYLNADDLAFSSWDFDDTPCAGNTAAPSTQNGAVTFRSVLGGTVRRFAVSAAGVSEGTYTISNVTIDGRLVLFDRRPVRARLTGTSVGGGDDRLVVSTDPAYKARNAAVRFFRVVSGRDVVVGTERTNARGTARVVVDDTRPRVTRYYAIVAGTRGTARDRSNVVRVR